MWQVGWVSGSGQTHLTSRQPQIDLDLAEKLDFGMLIWAIQRFIGRCGNPPVCQASVLVENLPSVMAIHALL
jgi:hypothetical protein